MPNLATQKLYDLQEFVKEKIEDDSILIAQSMGGVLAVGLALKHPQKIKGLVLLATSGGLNLKHFIVQTGEQIIVNCLKQRRTGLNKTKLNLAAFSSQVWTFRSC